MMMMLVMFVTRASIKAKETKVTSLDEVSFHAEGASM